MVATSRTSRDLSNSRHMSSRSTSAPVPAPSASASGSASQYGRVEPEHQHRERRAGDRAHLALGEVDEAVGPEDEHEADARAAPPAARSPMPSSTTAGRSLTGTAPAEEDGPGEVAALEQLAGVALEPHRALLEEHGAAAQLGGEVERLLDEHARDAGGVDVADDVEQLADDRRRQAERELVDAEQPRVDEQRLGDRELLLLAAGQRCRPRLPRRGRSCGNRSSSRSIRAVELVADGEAAELEVLADGEVGEHGLAAHHQRRRPAGSRSSAGTPVTSWPSRVTVPERRRLEPGEHAQHRRLAGAVGAEQAEDLARLDVERHAEQHRHRAVGEVDVVAARAASPSSMLWPSRPPECCRRRT